MNIGTLSYGGPDKFRISESGGIAAERNRMLRKFIFLTVISAAVLSFDEAVAGTGGEEFADVWDTLKEWIQGTLGRVVCGSMILVGIVAGVARQSISAFAVGIGGGIGLYNTPTVIESVLSATLSDGGMQLLPAAVQSTVM